MNDLFDTPKQQDLVYDVGLHEATDTEFYLRKGFRVVAFDANPEMVASAREKLGDFIDRGRLTIVEGAIVDPASLQPGQTTVRFYKNDDNTGWGTTCLDWAERNARMGTESSVIEVGVVDFAAVMAQHGVPHFMKIDIEGCDAVCLEALRRFTHRPDYISIESEKTSLANLRGEIELFSELGYDSFQAVEQSAIPDAQIPPYPAREGEYFETRFSGYSSGLFGAELEDAWMPKAQTLRLYRVIRIGYYLLGDDGVMKAWRFPGARVLRGAVRRTLRLFTHAAVPGWYDTHARHRSVSG